MINPDNRTLILFHLYRSSKHKFIATVANVENAESCWHFDWVFLCILFLYIVYGWITILGYSKYELGTINLLYSNPKICYITPLPPPPPRHTGHLSTTTAFFCPQGGHFGEVRLYTRFQPDIICHSNYSRSSPCDHSRKRPVLVTTTYVKPPFELWLRLCNRKLSQATVRSLFGLPNWLFLCF